MLTCLESLSLSSLILTNCNIHDTGVHYLVKAGTKFETLRPDVNHISNYGARVLSNHLMSICTGLQHLSLAVTMMVMKELWH